MKQVNFLKSQAYTRICLTMQMPRGVPVATVAINNATNAGLLAVRMLAVGDTALQERCLSSFSLMDNAICVLSL